MCIDPFLPPPVGVPKLPPSLTQLIAKIIHLLNSINTFQTMYFLSDSIIW